MALYKMMRLADGMLSQGERLYPKLVGAQRVDDEALARMVEESSSFTLADVRGVIASLTAMVTKTLSDGNTVCINGLGTLRPVLGLVGKRHRGEWTDAAGRVTTGRNVWPKAINFRPDRRLIRNVRQGMTLVKHDDSEVTAPSRLATTREERAEAARRYLAVNGFMRVADYVRLTGTSRSTAALELRLLAGQEGSGVAARGAGSGKIYVPCAAE